MILSWCCLFSLFTVATNHSCQQSTLSVWRCKWVWVHNLWHVQWLEELLLPIIWSRLAWGQRHQHRGVDRQGNGACPEKRQHKVYNLKTMRQNIHKSCTIQSNQLPWTLLQGWNPFSLQSHLTQRSFEKLNVLCMFSSLRGLEVSAVEWLDHNGSRPEEKTSFKIN